MDMFHCKLTLEGRHYGMRKMPPVKAAPFGLRVISALSKLVANKGAVGALDLLKKNVPSKDGKVDLEGLDFSLDNKELATMVVSIISLISSLDPDEVSGIFTSAFSSDVYCEDQKLSDPVAFDLHFQNHPGDYYPVAIWVTWNNVKPFLKGIGAGVKTFLPQSPAPTTVSGK